MFDFPICITNLYYLVFISDLLVFIPAVLALCNDDKKVIAKESLISNSMLMPSLILIDYGHFQYNTISLGLSLASFVNINRGNMLIGAFFYSLSLNFKQMSLYYSLPIFFYMLKVCWTQTSVWRKGLKLTGIAFVVLTTFTILWWPYLISVDSTLQVLNRIFPFNRGIYEDKVANFWYCLSIVFKVKKFFSQRTLTICRYDS